MNEQSPSQVRDSRAAWIGVGAPILGLVLVIIGLAVAVFAGFAREQDRAFERSSTRLVASTMQERAYSIGRLNQDYANWSAAFDAVTTRWDADWITRNIYTSVADGMLIMRANGAVRYSWFAEPHRDEVDALSATAVRAAAAVPNLRRLGRAADVADTVARTYARVGDRLMLISVAPFTPEDHALRMARTGNQDFLVVIDIVTAPEWAATAEFLGLTELGFNAAAADAGGDTITLPLASADGAAVGAVEWRHDHPGAAMFQSRVWPVVLCLLIIGALTVLIARTLALRQVRVLANASAAVEASRAKSELLARVSHELRTPLNAVLGYAELIEESEASPSAREDAGRIIAAARHLGLLINDIIDQARIDSARIKYTLEPLPVAGMVAEVQGLMRPAAAAAGVRFTATSDPVAGFAYADHVRLRQCLLNILGNAMKFARGGVVSLRATLDGAGDRAMVVFTVQDNGVGMSADEIEAIFRPFGQANAAVAETHGGAGLGLSIARELARGMGGDVTVVSEPDNGACFTVTVPAATASALRAVA